MKVSYFILTLSSMALLAAAPAPPKNNQNEPGYAREAIERLLEPRRFGSIYWPDEPLPVNSLSKALGMNVTLAETHFQMPDASSEEVEYARQKNEISGEGSLKNESQANGETSTPTNLDSRASLIQDIFVTSSIERDLSYVLTINLELDNPFKVVDVYYESQGLLSKKHTNAQQQLQNETTAPTTDGRKRTGLFRISLPQSSLLVQLKQRIRYDDCLSVNHVQLSPTVDYVIDCVDCDKSDQEFIDKAFKKRVSQLDAELDAILSEKVLFGLQVLLSQQRLDLDTYLD